eukprot:902876-Amphidinium_carterae.1
MQRFQLDWENQPFDSLDNRLQPLCLGAFPCSLENRLQQFSLGGSASTGKAVFAEFGYGLEDRPHPACTVSGLSLGYRFFLWLPRPFSDPLLLSTRPLGWLPPTCRVGEAAKPGPTICSVNPGGWSLVEPVLNLNHDVVAVQETFVLRDKVNSAKFIADKLGYYSSFTPARKTEGRP